MSKKDKQKQPQSDVIKRLPSSDKIIIHKMLDLQCWVIKQLKQKAIQIKQMFCYHSLIALGK